MISGRVRAAIPVIAGLFSVIGSEFCAPAATSDDPVLATIQQEQLTLKELEEFARELPSNQRVPHHLEAAGEWRRFMARELAKCLVFSKDARALRRHLSPEYVRAREYFIQEYLDYLMLRDFVYNRIDVSRSAHEKEFAANPQDYLVTPTVSLRYIRTRSGDAAASAAARLAGGEEFVSVERELSEVSPRYIGRVLGPFPNPEERTMIPPPREVIQLALELEQGQTSGPLQVGPFYFIVRTEQKTTGGAAGLEEVTEQVESRLRQKQGDALVKQLLEQLKSELHVQLDEALLLQKKNVRDDDILATVGAVRVTRREYQDLNGRVRGPAIGIANMQPTRLAAFVVPIMLAEGARMRGYLDRVETQRALRYYDLQHLATFYVDREVVDKTPLPTEREMRFRFIKHLPELKRANGGTTPTFEQVRPDILEGMILERRPLVEEEFVNRHLTRLGFRTNIKQPCSRITAFEALVKATKDLPPNCRILEITEALGKEETGTDYYVGVGRNKAWRISYDTPGGSASEFIVESPALINDGSTEFTSSPLYARLYHTWRYDTDSLFRYAIDRGIGDFAAKHNYQVQIVSRVELAYSPDDPTSATDCLVSYIASPVDDFVDDGLIIKYSGITGEITKRRAGDPEGQCPTCPRPDLPSSIIRDKVDGVRSSSTRKSPVPAAAAASRPGKS